MQPISTNLHGIFDYLAGAFLIVFPFLFEYHLIGGMGLIVPIVLGGFVLSYSLLTDYEWGLFPLIDMRAHLWLDLLVGVTLLASWPFFGFYEVTWWGVHLLMGLCFIVVAAFSRREPERRRPYLRPPESLPA